MPEKFKSTTVTEQPILTPENVDVSVDTQDQSEPQYVYRGFGAEVINHALAQAGRAVHPEDVSTVDRLLTMWQKPDLEDPKMIENTRKQLGRISAEFDLYLQNTLDSQFLHSAIFGKYVTKEVMTGGLRNRFIAKKEGEYVVDDATIRNFVEWLSAKTEKQQEKLDASHEDLKGDFKEGIRWAIHKRHWLDPEVEDRLAHLDRINVHVDDGFATREQGNAGSYTKGVSYDTVLVAPHLEATDLSETYEHEAAHVISGGEEIDDVKRKVMNKIFGKFGTTVIDEGLTEHLADSLNHSNFYTMNPYERKGDFASYPSYRVLMSLLIPGTDSVQGTRELYRTLYFVDPNSPRAVKPNINKLVEQWDEKYPGLRIADEFQSLKNNDDVSVLIQKLTSFEASHVVSR